MVFVVLVYWKIKKGSEEEFEKSWEDKFKIGYEEKKGLLGEFLSKMYPQDGEWNTWDLTKENMTTYVNTGVWKSEEDFKKAVKNYTSQKKDFEADFRSRAMLHPVMYRLGSYDIDSINGNVNSLDKVVD